MNLGQFYSLISRAIGRGTSLDDRIPDWVAEAANLLEGNYTFAYMRRTGSVVLDAGSNQVDLPERIKALEWVQMVYSGPMDGTSNFRELVGVDPKRVIGISAGAAQGYWLDGIDYLYLDAVADVALDLRLRWAEYTDWPVAENANPTLLQRGMSALKNQALLLFATEMRDPRMVDLYNARMSESVNIMLRAEEDLKWEHQNDLVMRADYS